MFRRQPETFHLTDGFIDALKPEATQKDYYDDKLAGFGVRVSPGGAKAFFLFYRSKLDGKNKRPGLGRADKGCRAKDARNLAKSTLAAIAAGADPASKRNAGNVTFADLVKKYFDDHSRKHKATWRQEELALKRYIPKEWQQRRLASLSHNEIEQLHTKVGEENGKVSANRLLALLHHMFAKARSWSLVDCENPCANIKRFHEAQRQRFLAPEELQRINIALLAERDWRWREFFPLSVMLGLRRGELLSLAWNRVNLGNATLTLDKTKNRREHVLPLPKPAIEIFSRLPSREVSQWVFPGGRSGREERHLSSPGRAWCRLMERAGLSDASITIHTLRHTLASWMVGQGASLKIIGAALNHQSAKTTDRYAHLALEPVRAAMENVAALMAACAPADTLEARPELPQLPAL
jgi:integrase